MTDDDRIFRLDHQQKRIGARQLCAFPAGGRSGKTPALVVVASVEITQVGTHASRVGRADSKVSFANVASQTNVTRIAAAAAAAAGIAYQRTQLHACVTFDVANNCLEQRFATYFSGMTIFHCMTILC